MPKGACSEIGGYSVQPASGAPNRNEHSRIRPAGGKIQKLVRLSHGNATSRAPICSGMTKFPKAPVNIGMMTIQTIIEPWTE